MDWIAHTVSSFGRSINLPGLALDEEGALRLRTGSGGAIEIHHLSQGDKKEVLLLRSEPAPYDLPRRILGALLIANLRRLPGLALQVGAFDGQLLLCTRLDERQLSQPSLEENLALLKKLHEDLRTQLA